MHGLPWLRGQRAGHLKPTKTKTKSAISQFERTKLSDKRCMHSIVVSYPLIFQSSAEAENKDNEAEQKRLFGKKVRYGELIQVI